jgi:7,8-dihydropterin-6-yl-methyl-4-(beta-D-ribofuranosyl)aminobenzene 5'-phosphate synthase
MIGSGGSSESRLLGRRTVLLALGAAAGLAARYVVGVRRVEASWLNRVDVRLAAIGEIEWVSILPLVERLSPDMSLRGEPGLSYLVRTPHAVLIFDCGLGTGRNRSALASNAECLGVRLEDTDAVVISHLHRDHVGGQRALSRRTFAFSDAPLEPRGIPAYVPAPMRHSRADVVVTDGPRVISSGIALSSHDSTPWTFDEFATLFGERYRTLRVGEELRIEAPTATAAVATT